MKPDFIKLTAKHPQGDRHVWIARSDIVMLERLPAGMGTGIMFKSGSVHVTVRENPETVLERAEGLRLDGPISSFNKDGLGETP